MEIRILILASMFSMIQCDIVKQFENEVEKSFQEIIKYHKNEIENTKLLRMKRDSGYFPKIQKKQKKTRTCQSMSGSYGCEVNFCII